MLSYTVKRLGLSALIILLAMILLLALIHVIPGDPARVALGPRATPAMAEALRARMGLDQPLPIQVLRFVTGTLTGDLGTDVMSNRPVATIIAEQLPFSLALIATAIGWSVLLGIPLGCLAAVYPGSVLDRVLGVLSVSVIALPSFIVAIYGLLLFAVQLQWLPAIGAGNRGDWGDQLSHLVLPALAVGLGWVGYLARLVRASMLEVLGENHVRTLRAFGVAERRIVFKYVLKLAILPTVTLLGIGIGNMLSGAVFAEIVFSRPGIGKAIYDAVIVRNYPVVLGCVLVSTVFLVLVMLIADLLVAWLDPRSRQSL